MQTKELIEANCLIEVAIELLGKAFAMRKLEGIKTGDVHEAETNLFFLEIEFENLEFEERIASEIQDNLDLIEAST